MATSANSGKRRIFFGGTFNPIHIGHTRVALECQQQLDADLVFVPCGDPPHKALPEVSASRRLAMVELAAAELNATMGEARFSVDALEVESQERSFTLNTLQRLRQRYPQGPLYWLIGMDSLVNLATWYRWQELTDWANILVVNRPGWQMPSAGVVFDWLASKQGQEPKDHGHVVLADTTPLAIASSVLRQQLHKQDFGKFLLPESVRQYAYEQRLYHRDN